MPSLCVFGRRWSISSDDFVVPEITEGLIRFSWYNSNRYFRAPLKKSSPFFRFVISFFVYMIRAKPEACVNLHLYMIGSLIETALVLVLCFATAYVSSLGTIVNASPRRYLKTLIYLRCPLIIFEIIWNILGSVWLHSSNMANCDSTFTAGTVMTIVGGWLMLLILLFGLILNFDPTGTIHRGDINLADEARKMWRKRVKMFFICASRSDKAKIALEDAAELFVDLFADSDLVWTDVWAAMLLLASKEMRVLNERARKNVSSDAPSWMTVESASRTMEFSLGVYGWPYYMVGRGCSIKALWTLAKRGRCCGRGCGCDSALIIKDNCCMCNTAAMLLQTGLTETDLFYVNLHNEIWETPFVACFDHVSKSIIVAVRGSLSMRDAMTDLTAAEESLELNSCPPYVENVAVLTKKGGDDGTPKNEIPSFPAECIKCRAHRGMLSSARYVASILDNERILDDMFVLQPDYDLVFTGHSLGAGVASLLGIIFKPRFTDLKVYAFSPPGCVISREGVEFTKSFVYSVVYGDDL
uniref:sn-1-specific diacylglycerol lipase n=1 Tax=Romanomermis culicivorax TaxID=13658 RepID=A0A915I0A1_ROMCU